MKSRHVLAFLITAALASTAAAQIDFSDWHSTAEINSIFTTLSTTHPSRCAIVTIPGASVEGRSIRALKISDSVGTDDPDEGDVVILAAHHAREWMSIETALYIAEQLLTRYGTDPVVTAAVDSLEIWIVPVVNPDGFEYTQTTYRYWRKNRRNNGDGTFGVDLNRNWGYQWGLASGSSADTMNDQYHGSSAWSEPEVIAIRDFVLGRDHLKTLITYHSYSQLFLSPWGYSTAEAEGEPTLDLVQERTIRSIQAVHGITYDEEIWYTASGETTDYMWGQLRIAAFTPEVRPTGALGNAGFNPAVSMIQPTIEENLAGALSLLHDAHAQEVWIRDHAGDTGAEPSAVWTGTNWSAPFWTSPDISTTPAELVEGAIVTLNVHVNNATGTTRTGVRVDAYYTDPRISLEFPSSTSVLIGSQTVSVPAGGLTVPFSWTVPTGANSWGEMHWCVGAVVYHETDMPLTTQAERTNNVAIRNFQTTEALFGTNLVVAATNFLETDAELAVFVDEGALPPGWRVVLPRPEPPKRVTTTIQRKARLLDAKGALLAPGETIYLPVRVVPPPGAAPGARADVNVHAALLPLMPGKREAVGNGFTYRVAVPP